MDDVYGIIEATMIVVGVIIVVALLLTLPVMWLWNWLMPVIFELPTITFWQALGLSVLCSFLFKPTSVSSSKG